jgi:hypothetical protein
LAFAQFNGAFEDLLGRDEPLTEAEMEAYTDFVLRIVPPPNPVRELDNSLTPEQSNGRVLFESNAIVAACPLCHPTAPELGFFGTAGDITIALETQEFKVPQLRNMHARVGMFGVPSGSMFGGTAEHMGPQIRGFGYIHDGSVDTLYNFVGASIFGLGDYQRRLLEQYMLAFPSDLAPIVGQQATLISTAAFDVMQRIDLLEARADQGECDLTVKGVAGGEERGWVRASQRMFQSDRRAEPPLAGPEIRALASATAPLTYTCGPPGSGRRVGVDRDEDGVFDRDELDRCGDPADPNVAPSQALTCIGDCDRDCSVSVGELVRGIRLGLGENDDCTAFDTNTDGNVGISELVGAVHSSLGGICQGT